MKIECAQDKIKEVIDMVSKVSGKHMTLPVLSCVLIVANKNNTLTFKSTNLDIGLEVTIPAKVDTEGTVAVPSSVIASFISNMPFSDKPIKIELKEGNIVISNSKTSGTIKSQPNDDFPTIPRVNSENKFSINAIDFVKGLKSVWYSSSVSSIKPELSSVYVYCEGEFVVFVATDSFRLAEKKVRIKKSSDFEQILIPHKNIPDIINVLDKVNGEVDVVLDKNQVSFSYKDVFLVSRVVDGVFPDYKQIIPKQYATEITVLKQDFVNTLKLSNVFSDKFNQVNIKIDSKDKICQIKTKNNDIGENTSIIDSSITGDSIEINFNYKYIIDCFQSINSDSVTLSFSGLNRPMVINPVSDQTFRYLVMPMNR